MIVYEYIKALRYKNLIIIALTQYLLRWCILKPLVGIHELELQFSEFNFFLLVLSTVLVAGAGYLINDYFDLKIDRINKPEKIIVGKTIKRRVAMASHLVINAIAIVIGLYISIKVGHWEFGFIYLFGAFTLWFYSIHFKTKYFTGNLLIAIMAALVPLTVGIFDIVALSNHYKILYIENEEIIYHLAQLVNVLFIWICAFAAFAFILTLAREITKDITDIEGDRIYGCETIPIVSGIAFSKKVLIGLYVFCMLGLIAVQQLYLPDKYSFLYMLFLSLGLIILTIITIKAKNKKDFLLASAVNKWLSVAGIAYALLANYLISSM